MSQPLNVGLSDRASNSSAYEMSKPGTQGVFDLNHGGFHSDTRPRYHRQVVGDFLKLNAVCLPETTEDGISINKRS